MKRSFSIFFISVFFSFVHVAISQNTIPYNTQKVQLQQQQLAKFNFNLQQEFDETTIAGRKSVGKALLYSLLIPGAGEMYAAVLHC